VGLFCKRRSLDNSPSRKQQRFPFVWQPIGMPKGSCSLVPAH
jgi:hypothetical protein